MLCLIYDHHCVFIMCGDLCSTWGLFGFCAGIAGKEHCPLCTLARVDQWRGGTATECGRARDVPISLAPSVRYILCLLHCTLRVGEYALEHLIMHCINEKEGRPNYQRGKEIPFSLLTLQLQATQKKNWSHQLNKS